MYDVCNVGIVLDKEHYDFLVKEASLAKCKLVEELCEEAIQNVEQNNNGKYLYLHFKDVEWNKKNREIQIINDVLAELFDYEFVRIDSKTKEIIEQYNGGEHQPLMNVQDGLIYFS